MWKPKKAKDMKDWEDNEIKVLIELWSQYANLFNTKHKNYFNRDARQKSLKNIKLKLKEQNTIATEKQIPVKLINLKNYYGGQKGELIPVKPIALVSIKYIKVTRNFLVVFLSYKMRLHQEAHIVKVLTFLLLTKFVHPFQNLLENQKPPNGTQFRKLWKQKPKKRNCW